MNILIGIPEFSGSTRLSVVHMSLCFWSCAGWLLITVLELAVRGTTSDDLWRCPVIGSESCSCDIPHTLRCTGNGTTMFTTIARSLRGLPGSESISLLDCTIQNVYILPGPLFEGVSLHGLVISSGDIRQVDEAAFIGLTTPLQALGLPNNVLDRVPTAALAALPNLERLDLSHNKLKKLENSSFEGLPNLTFLDLSDNLVTSISSSAFSNLPELRILRLQGNRLRVGPIAALQGLHLLQELDLSSNLLAGPLGPGTLPRLSKLKTLSLAHNQLSSLRRGALAGMDSITSLSLHHNQIDVLEDHAFRATNTLVQLNLGFNRIIAISGASLAHLSRLEVLDLSHNFLRALTSDLITPLKRLRELHLDDNDISIVAKHVLESANLRRLTLADNPLNCDCGLIELAMWLSNATSLPAADRSSAVCATPPSLENGALQEVSIKRLVCGVSEDSAEEPLPPMDVPVDSASAAVGVSASVPGLSVPEAKVILHGFQFDGNRISLLWNVDAPSVVYSCDALFVYESFGGHEVLLESKPLKCNSSQISGDSRSLLVALPASDLQRGHRYKFCIVLLESGANSDDSALVLGCSDVIPLVISPITLVPTVSPSTRIFINTLIANYTAGSTPTPSSSSDPNSITVSVQLYTNHRLIDFSRECSIMVTVSSMTSPVFRRNLTCASPLASFRDLPPAGPYEVCATLSQLSSEPLTRCVTVHKSDVRKHDAMNILFSISFFVFSTLLFLVVYHGRKSFTEYNMPSEETSTIDQW